MMTQTPHQTEHLKTILDIQPGEVVIGQIVDLNNNTGMPLVDFPGNLTQHAVAALTTIPLSQEHLGREVALLFAEGNLAKPVVMGLIRTDLESSAQKNRPLVAQVDDEKIVLSAEKEIVLNCGKATITLTRAGKIIIRGAYIVSRAAGVNCIKGGSIQMN